MRKGKLLPLFFNVGVKLFERLLLFLAVINIIIGLSTRGDGHGQRQPGYA